MKKEPGLTHLLVGLCGIFAVLAAVEWGYYKYSIGQAKKALNEEIVPNVSIKSVQTEEFSLPPQDHYEAIIERPLMVKGRRPVNEISEPAAPNVVRNTKMNMQLMGVVMTPQGMTALLKDNQGKYRRVRKDESIDGWFIEELYEDKAVVVQGGATHELMLRKPKPKVAPVKRKPPANRQNKRKLKKNQRGSEK